MSPDTPVEAVLAGVEATLNESLERLFTLLRIRSVSTDPGFASECRRAADWISEELELLGFSASVRQTPGHPIVVAHGPEQAGPHVLFYAHYDVQPVDPMDLWVTEPFEPVLTTADDGRQIIVARGASDDKGQMLTFIEACRAWKAVTGGFPIQISLIIEGEEESGGKNLPSFLGANRAELGVADIALVCDTNMWDRQSPSITTMLRGILVEELEITCAKRDLHSGLYGGAARNANHVLAQIIASLHAPDGSVSVAGFYDDVAEIPQELKEQWSQLDFDEGQFLGDVGLSVSAGETNRSVLETIWARPTCEVNGMSGGYAGEGFKTVIPGKARAKISFRLVSGMQPETIRAAFRAHVLERIPSDCSVTFSGSGGSPAITVPGDGAHLRNAHAGLSDEWGKPAVLTGSGGSIPVAVDFKQILGLDTLFIGFAQADDQVHSPNEKYDLESFRRGIRSWVRILAAMQGKRDELT